MNEIQTHELLNPSPEKILSQRLTRMSELQKSEIYESDLYTQQDLYEATLQSHWKLADLVLNQAQESLNQGDITSYINTVDQVAINLPIDGLTSSQAQLLRQQALAKGLSEIPNNESDPNLFRAIFMLYHHGAKISPDLSAQFAQHQLNKARKINSPNPSLEYYHANEYLKSETESKKYLEKYIQLSLSDSDFDIDNPNLEKLSQYPTLRQDLANYHQRTAHYQQITQNPDFQKHTNLADIINNYPTPSSPTTPDAGHSTPTA